MISDIKPENQQEVLDLFLQYQDITWNQMYFNSKEEINNMILSIIHYIEIYTNCKFIQSIVRITTKSNKFILPFWPIEKILSIKNSVHEELTYHFNNNKLEILGEENGDHIITYKVGYPITIVKQLPISIIMEQIMLSYSEKGILKNSELLTTLLNKVSHTYGMGD